MTVMMSRVCDNCPFRKEGGIRLDPRRAEELANNATHRNGSRFHCHKSYYAQLNKNDMDSCDDDGEPTPAPSGTLDCLGSAIFGIKQGVYTQPIQMAERLGLFDSDAIQQDDKDAIFDSIDEMLDAQEVRRKC